MSYFIGKMNRLDRTMGMILLLRGGRVVSATELASRFEVSVRTVYRDIELLSGLGVPISADMGRAGGFRLREGYFLPPITLGPEEAASLLLGIILMRRLRVMPFPKEADFAERKLLAALPPETREAMERASRFIGFERVPADLLHPERDDPQGLGRAGTSAGEGAESAIVGTYLRALLSRSRVMLSYRSPYREKEAPREVEPLGLLWDRDRWYLAGRRAGGSGGARTWRADRVLALSPGRSMPPLDSDFDAASLLDRKWLRGAMEAWRAEAPALMAMREDQAELLKRDWFYGTAVFEAIPGGRVSMSYGEYRPEAAAALLRWLGPGAELLEPREWRPIVAAGLRELLAAHEG
jgi:predicted DNA-binding transcriptional regulator YafY